MEDKQLFEDFSVNLDSQRHYGIDKDVAIEDLYQAFKARLLSEGYIEPKEKRWVRPKYEEIEGYFLLKLKVKQRYSSHMTEKIRTKEAKDEAEKFFNYWDSLDWKSNNTRIKSWKGRAATWIGKYEKNKNNPGKTNKTLSATERVRANIERDSL